MTTEKANVAHLASYEMSVSELNPDLSLIPPEYYKFMNLLSKKEADKLNVHRSYSYTVFLKLRKALPLQGQHYRQHRRLVSVRIPTLTERLN